MSEDEAARILADIKKKQAAKASAEREAGRLTEDLNLAVREAMQLQGVSRQELARASGYSLPRLYQIRDGRY